MLEKLRLPTLTTNGSESMLDDKQMKVWVLSLHVVAFCLVLYFDWPRNILLSPHKLSNHRVLVGFSHIMYSYCMHVCLTVFLKVLEMKTWVKCLGITKYVCLKCAKPLCNKSLLTKIVQTEKLVYCVSCSQVPIPNAQTKQATTPVEDSNPIYQEMHGEETTNALTIWRLSKEMSYSEREHRRYPEI